MLKSQIRRGDALPISESLPKVQAMSDVSWIVWADTAGSKASTLKYIFQYGIASDKTKYIIEQAAEVAEDTFNAPWPGREFLEGTPQSKHS